MLNSTIPYHARAPGSGSAAGRKSLAPPYCSRRAVFVSAFFSFAPAFQVLHLLVLHVLHFEHPQSLEVKGEKCRPVL